MPKGARSIVERHASVLAAALLGIAVGFAARSVLASTTPLSVGALALLAAVGLAALTDLAGGSLRAGLARALRLAAGRYPGHRRLERERFHQTRISDYRAGVGFEPERWVDLASLDSRGYAYGVARSPDYVPLYGNGLTRIPTIRLSLDRQTRAIDRDAEALIDAQIADLATENANQNRPFNDSPLVRLLSFSPPVDGHGPLQLHCEPVGHRRYAAVIRLLREDRDGALRRRFEITPRHLENPMVCGCLGVEIAVVTSDEKLVLAHRGDLASHYRNLLLTTIGRGMNPDFDASPTDAAQLDPCLTVQRGAREELGIEVDGQSTRFLALGLETSRMDPDLLGYIEVEQSFADIEAAYMAARAKDRWESTTLSSIDFNPYAVSDLLSSGRAVTPATPMNLVFAISDRFGEQECERAMTRRFR